MKIRPALESDDSAWEALRQRLWPDCSADRHALEMRELRQSKGVILLAEKPDDLVVGFAEISVRNDHVPGTSEVPVPYLEGWFVDPDERGQGVGRALIEGACAWALEHGFRELASDAELDNEKSIDAHVALGFREVGRGVQFVRSVR